MSNLPSPDRTPTAFTESKVSYGMEARCKGQCGDRQRWSMSAIAGCWGWGWWWRQHFCRDRTACQRDNHTDLCPTVPTDLGKHTKPWLLVKAWERGSEKEQRRKHNSLELPRVQSLQLHPQTPATGLPRALCTEGPF